MVFVTYGSRNDVTQGYTYAPQTPLIKPIDIPIPEKAPYPEKISEELPPNLSSEGVVLLEPKSFKVLYAKNENQRLYPASITKLLTALTALDFYNLDQVLSVPEVAYEGQIMGLVPGEKIKVRDLLYGLLIKSGNDAAMVLAGSDSVKYDLFVYAMNEKALALNMTNTHFNNPTGLDDDNHYSTPRDLAILGAVVNNHPLLSEIVKIKNTVVTDVAKTHWHELENVNILIGDSGINGMKTGYTPKANECLLSRASREGRTLIGVILNSQDRFGETKALLDWGYRVYSW
ncbi:MAG: hypothetical protein A3F33_00060 [Candidatus Woykebacteria bacterium RIFCSPHIGHO2_12_FULL_43_10]|nr:MAG: hypothetical protein A3F33_00060 [Candidatus Woykebacteria bacterium RIFCSPHIGHO2_12_FULL_43_10]